MTATAPPIRSAARDLGAPVAADPRRWWTLAVLCVSLLVIVVDNTIVNVALPTLVTELGTSVGDLQWVVDAYTLVFAGLLLTAGALGDLPLRRGPGDHHQAAQRRDAGAGRESRSTAAAAQ